MKTILKRRQPQHIELIKLTHAHGKKKHDISNSQPLCSFKLSKANCLFLGEINSSQLVVDLKSMQLLKQTDTIERKPSEHYYDMFYE